MRVYKLPINLKDFKNKNNATKTIKNVIALWYNVSEILKKIYRFEKK